MPPLTMKLVFDLLETKPMPFFARPIAKKIAERMRSAYVGPLLELNLDYMESELGKSLWFAGDDFTAADIQMSYPLEAAIVRAGLDENHPNLMAFLERIHSRPAYQRALERGGDFQVLS